MSEINETIQIMSDEKIKDSIQEFVTALMNLRLDQKIPVALSNRHLHISKNDFHILFGEDAELHPLKPLSQPGQYASEETVDLIGPKKTIERVRILGPFRDKTQIEISISDGIRDLGIDPPIRQSGKVSGTPGITLRGPKGELTIKEGIICAGRHVHMTPKDAKKFGVKDKQLVSVYFVSRRAGILDDVLIRVSPKYKLEMHVDIDEGNALGLKNGDYGFILPDIDYRIFAHSFKKHASTLTKQFIDQLKASSKHLENSIVTLFESHYDKKPYPLKIIQDNNQQIISLERNAEENKEELIKNILLEWDSTQISDNYFRLVELIDEVVDRIEHSSRILVSIEEYPKKLPNQLSTLILRVNECVTVLCDSLDIILKEDYKKAYKTVETKNLREESKDLYLSILNELFLEKYNPLDALFFERLARSISLISEKSDNVAKFIRKLAANIMK